MAIQTFEELEVYAGFKYEASLSTSLLSYALTISPSHIAFGSLSGNSYAGNDLPDSGYNTSTFYINCRNANSISVYLTPDDNSLSPQLNKYTGTWSGWQSIGGDNKFIKGQAIPFYDTDGETLLNSILPENLVYYDGESGDEVSSNFIYASPSTVTTMSSASTFYSPTFDNVINSRGSGFELSNGSIKCNKKGVVHVTVKAFTSASSSSSIWGNITINGTADSKSGGYNGGLTYNIALMQGVYNVNEGDLINVQIASWLAGYKIESSTNIICEYVEDYYITQALSNTKKVLYSGGTYTTTTVTLSESVSKYDYLKVIFVNNDNVYSSVDVYQPDGKNITAWANTTANGDGSYAKTATFSISGNTITSRSSQYQHYMRQSLITTTTVQNVGIYAVIGEKFGNKPDTDIDKIYPVGSIYMSVNNTSPSELFGGTWTQIKDTFLLSAGDTYTAGNTGGEATHTLTTDEMPSHSHAWSRRSTSSVASGTGLTGASGTEYSGDITEAIRATGGGQAHNNMPPYLVVYMWQRTA